MVLDSTKEFAGIISNLINEQQVIKNNLSSDEESAQLIIKNRSSIIVSGTVIVTQKVYDSTSFILDHPVLGELDSSTLQLDGGYSSSTVLSSITF